jgi:hypothetical protein
MFNGTERFSWLYHGYYGIGSTTPASFLHVNGNATIAGTLFLDGFNISARLSGNNQTLTDTITGDNTTQGNLITGNNNTLYAQIGTKVNITDANSNNNTI